MVFQSSSGCAPRGVAPRKEGPAAPGRAVGESPEATGPAEGLGDPLGLFSAEHAVDLGPALGAGALGGSPAVGHLDLFAVEVALLPALHAVTVELSHVIHSLIDSGSTCNPPRSASSTRDRPGTPASRNSPSALSRTWAAVPRSQMAKRLGPAPDQHEARAPETTRPSSKPGASGNSTDRCCWCRRSAVDSGTRRRPSLSPATSSPIRPRLKAASP